MTFDSIPAEPFWNGRAYRGFHALGQLVAREERKLLFLAVA